MNHRQPTAISRSDALKRWADYERRLKRAARARHFWHDHRGAERREHERRERLDRHRAFFNLYYLIP